MADEKELIEETEEATEERPKDEPEKEPEVKYTDADVDAIIERKLARERDKFERKLAQERDKWNEELESQRKQASEAEKLKGMNELERAQHESEVYRKENEDLKRRLSIAEQMDIARDELSKEGIRMGDELLSTFITENADTNKKTLDSIKDMWPKAVDAAVKEELKRTPPKDPNGKQPTAPSAGKAFAEKYNKRMKGEE